MGPTFTWLPAAIKRHQVHLILIASGVVDHKCQTPTQVTRLTLIKSTQDDAKYKLSLWWQSPKDVVYQLHQQIGLRDRFTLLIGFVSICHIRIICCQNIYVGVQILLSLQPSKRMPSLIMTILLLYLLWAQKDIPLFLLCIIALSGSRDRGIFRGCP